MDEKIRNYAMNLGNSTESITSPSADDEMAFDKLYPAVVECFFVIICGCLSTTLTVRDD